MKIILTKIGWNAKQNVKCSNQVDGKDKLYELMFFRISEIIFKGVRTKPIIHYPY